MIRTICIFMSAVCLFLTACSTSKNISKEQRTPLFGSWKKDNLRLSIINTGEFQVTVRNRETGSKTYSGKIERGRNFLVISMNSEEFPCATQKGVYTFTKQENNTVFVNDKDDSCNERVQLFQGSWTRYSSKAYMR